MAEGVEQFGEAWRVELSDPATADTITVAYAVTPLPEPIG